MRNFAASFWRGIRIGSVAASQHRAIATYLWCSPSRVRCGVSFLKRFPFLVVGFRGGRDAVYVLRRIEDPRNG